MLVMQLVHDAKVSEYIMDKTAFRQFYVFITALSEISFLTLSFLAMRLSNLSHTLTLRIKLCYVAALQTHANAT